MSLNLIPNEIVGYRIKPDWYNYTVVLVKKHGASSKSAGLEYEIPLAYCKNLMFASNFILNHSLKSLGEISQKEKESLDGSVADIDCLVKCVEKAQKNVEQAVLELEQRLVAQKLLKPRDLLKS